MIKSERTLMLALTAILLSGVSGHAMANERFDSTAQVGNVTQSVTGIKNQAKTAIASAEWAHDITDFTSSVTASDVKNTVQGYDNLSVLALGSAVGRSFGALNGASFDSAVDVNNVTQTVQGSKNKVETAIGSQTAILNSAYGSTNDAFRTNVRAGNVSNVVYGDKNESTLLIGSSADDLNY